MFRRFLASLICVAFLFSNLQYSYAQDFSIDQLPLPGSMINVTPAYVPLTLKGLIIHPENALKFDFLMDTGHSHLKGNDLSDEALKMMKYFLTALTISEDDLWVNLSPYEKGRTIQKNFGQTMMGRDLLAQDYVLKQLTSSLIYPEKALGKEFWQEVYSKAAKEFGTTTIPVNTFNKVWIVPSEAVVWEHEGKVFIVKSRLKVMLEEDYLSLQRHGEDTAPVFTRPINSLHTLASQVTRNIVLPVLEKEVNEGKNFAQLRQMYQAMILATWYKRALRKSILNEIYTDKGKLAGIGYKNSSDVEIIYQQYLKAFKKGAFNLIKEDIDPSTGQSVPRKYFSGGFRLSSQAMVSPGLKRGVTSFLLALGIWTGTLTLNQQQAVAQASQPTGDMVDVVWQADLAPMVKSTTVVRDAAMFSLSAFLRGGDSGNGGSNNNSRKETAPAVVATGTRVAGGVTPDRPNMPEPLQIKRQTSEELLEFLQSKDGETRRDAVRILRERNVSTQEIIRGYVLALGAVSLPARKEAREELGKFSTEERVPEYLRALNTSTNSTVLLSVAVLLGELGDKRAVEPLLGLWEHSSGLVLSAAATALEKLNDPRVIGPFLEYLKPSDSRGTRSIRKVAGRTLENLGKETQFKLEDTIRIKLAVRQEGEFTDIFDFYEKALAYAREGYDFKVYYRPMETKLHHDIKYKIRDEFLGIQRGDLLSPQDSSTTQAMLPALKNVDDPRNLGGIALNAKMLNLQVNHDDKAMSLLISQQFLDKINFQGFSPRIISIHSIDLPSLVVFNSSK